MSIERTQTSNIKKWSTAAIAACCTLAMSCTPQSNEFQAKRASADKPQERSLLAGILAVQTQALMLADTLRELPGSTVKTGQFVPKAWAPGPFGLVEVTFNNPANNTEIAIDYATQYTNSPKLVGCDDWQMGGYGEYGYLRIRTFSPNESTYQAGTGENPITIDFNCMGDSETVAVSSKNSFTSSSAGSANPQGVVQAARALYTIQGDLPH